MHHLRHAGEHTRTHTLHHTHQLDEALRLAGNSLADWLADQHMDRVCVCVCLYHA